MLFRVHLNYDKARETGEVYCTGCGYWIEIISWVEIIFEMLESTWNGIAHNSYSNEKTVNDKSADWVYTWHLLSKWVLSQCLIKLNV